MDDLFTLGRGKRDEQQEQQEEITQTNPNHTSTRIAYMRSTSIQEQSRENSTKVRFFPLQRR